MAITRTQDVDDDGSFTTGTVRTNAWKQQIYDQIDALFATLAPGSGQLAFPATQNPSANVNTLDDYEEGTWTLTVACGTSGTITLTSNTGAYTKIGRMVVCTGYFLVASVSSPVGNVTLNGLPFTAASGLQFRSSVSLTCNGFTSGLTHPWGQLLDGGTGIQFYNFAAGGVANAAAMFQANAEFRLTAIYFV